MKQELYHFFKQSSPLSEYSHNVASQCGEDGIIKRINDLICPANKFCVEFGAWDGKYFSNCYSLITNHHWAAIMIEANPDKYKALVNTYAGNDNVIPVNRLVDFEGINTLDNILADPLFQPSLNGQN